MATSETQPTAGPDKSGFDQASTTKTDARGERGTTKDGSVTLADELREAHKARTEVPGAPGVDGRLDNRRGDQRPQHTDQVKPQQIDGPDITEQYEWTRKVLAEKKATTEKADGPVVGMFSPGPHGRSDE